MVSRDVTLWLPRYLKKYCVTKNHCYSDACTLLKKKQIWWVLQQSLRGPDRQIELTREIGLDENEEDKQSQWKAYL